MSVTYRLSVFSLHSVYTAKNRILTLDFAEQALHFPALLAAGLVQDRAGRERNMSSSMEVKARVRKGKNLT